MLRVKNFNTFCRHYFTVRFPISIWAKRQYFVIDSGFLMDVSEILLIFATMTDTMTPQQRSRCMAAIKSKDTKPELVVRRFLFSKGLRYRVNNKKLPGSPDIVLKKYKAVVFIDGCFWHGHEGCKYYRLPQTNTDFWKHKIAMNYARDYANNIELKLAGWRVFRVWECEINTKAKRVETLENLYLQIIGIQSKPREYGELPDEISAAAEPQSEYKVSPNSE